MSEFKGDRELTLLRLENPDVLRDFFEQSEKQNPEVFGGYVECVNYFIDGLNVATQEARTANEDFSFSLPLKPARRGSSEKNPEDMDHDEYREHSKEISTMKVYGSEEPPAVTAMLFAAYELTKAEQMVDTRSDKSEYGSVIVHGKYHEAHIYFVEEYNYDEIGEYMSWSVRSGFPEELLPEQEIEPLPNFITTGQKQENWDSLLDALDAIPTTEEPEEVVIWLRQKSEKQSRKAA